MKLNFKNIFSAATVAIMSTACIGDLDTIPLNPTEVTSDLLTFSPPGIELLPYSFSSLKWPADPKLSAIQELFLPPSLKTSACSLFVLCT